MESFLLFFTIFLASFLCIFVTKTMNKKDKLGAQFVVTGVFLLVFYAVCLFSGICTILNFIFNWVL